MTNKIHQTPLAQSISQGKFSEPPALEPEANENSAAVAMPRDGSTLYYATHRLSADAQQRLMSQLQLNNTLANVLLGVREAPVAQTKLQWWNEELARLHDSQARHPNAKRCEPWLAKNNSALEQLTAILDAATAARFDAPENDSDWQAVMSRDYNARLQLIFTALTENTAPDLQALAMAAGWMDILRQLPTRIHHDQLLFPPSWQQDANIDTATMHKSIRVQGRETDEMEDHAAIQTLISRAVAVALTEFDSAITSEIGRSLLSQSETRVIPVWLRLRQAQLMVWQQSQPNLLRETITLTPLKKWWLAFRFNR